MAWNMATADGALFGNVCGLMGVVTMPGISTLKNVITRTSEVIKYKAKKQKESNGKRAIKEGK